MNSYLMQIIWRQIDEISAMSIDNFYYLKCSEYGAMNKAFCCKGLPCEIHLDIAGSIPSKNYKEC